MKTATKTAKVKTVATTARFIAAGIRGTAFAELSEAQVAKVKLNDSNTLALEHRTDAQLIASRKNAWQDSLGYDSRSYVGIRNGTDNTFWLGTVDQAIAQGIVKRATATVDGVKATTIYLLADWQEGEKRSQFVATDDTIGRAELRSVKHGELRRKGSTKNSLFVRDVDDIKLVATKAKK